MIKNISSNKIINFFLKLIFLCLTSSFVLAENNLNFQKALLSAITNSPKIKSEKYLYESKRKLITSSNTGKDWNSSFTVTYNNNNKKYDHTGSFLNEETISNTLSLKKNIYDWGVAKNAISIAKKNYAIQKNNFLLARQNLVIETLNSYLNLYKYNKILKLRKSNVEKFLTHVKASKLKLKAGAITPTTVAEAEARLARAEYQLVLAKSESENYKNEFLSIVGKDFNISELALPNIKLILPSSITDALDLAYKNNPYILNSEINKKIALLKRNKQILSNNPSLDIDFNYKNSESEVSGSSNDFSSYGSILTFKAPLFYNHSEKNLILSLNDEYQSVIQSEKEVSRKTKLRVSSAFNDYQNSSLNSKAVKKEMQAAKLALNGVKKEEEFGLRTLLDVLDNEIDVINSEVNLLKSKSNEVLKKFILKYEVGTLDITDIIKDYKNSYPDKNSFKVSPMIRFFNSDG